ncbi:MAG: hypothetical protein JHD35_08175 [Sphingopyxis sp.]|nr:hypothetical protein [Sphingopyxis sp.]
MKPSLKPEFISIVDFARMLGIGRTKAYERLVHVETIYIGRRRLVARKSAQVYARSLLSQGAGE